MCFVAVGTTDQELEAAIRHEFPKAELSREVSPALREWAATARRAAACSPVSDQIPADIAGTAFQWSVWRALTKIPAGSTISYGQLAVVIGRPRAIRAAARACALNPLAIIVPCHRVVGADGRLTGYRWGFGVKEKLIAIEKASVP